jgi:hypothetical protein
MKRFWIGWIIGGIASVITSAFIFDSGISTIGCVVLAALAGLGLPLFFGLTSDYLFGDWD